MIEVVIKVIKSTTKQKNKFLPVGSGQNQLHDTETFTFVELSQHCCCCIIRMTELDDAPGIAPQTLNTRRRRKQNKIKVWYTRKIVLVLLFKKYKRLKDEKCAFKNTSYEKHDKLI